MTSNGQEPPIRIGIWLVLFAVVIVALLNLVAFGRPGGVSTGRLADPDAYLRMLRILALRDGAGWYDELMPRVAAPEGIDIQWTRPLDLLILLPGLAIERLAGRAPRDALFLSGMLVSPVLHVAAAVAAAWGARAVWRGRAPLYAVVLMGSSPAVVLYSALGRADHHTLILLAIVLGLGGTLHALVPGAGRRVAVVAGLGYGFGIWVGPEVLLVAGPALAMAGVAATLAGDGRPLARQGLAVALGMAAMIAFAIGLEYPPAQWLSVVYDKVSVHHLALALAMGAVFAVTAALGTASRGVRLAGAGGAAAVALALLVLLFPGMLHGPLASADPAYLAHLHPTISENMALPPFGTGSPLMPVILLGGAVAAAIALAVAFPTWLQDGRWPAGLVLVATLLVTLAASFGAQRFALDLAAPAAIAGAGMVGAIRAATWPRSEVLRVALGGLGFIAVLCLPFIGAVQPATASSASAGASSPAGGCDWTAVARWLDRQRPGVSAQSPQPVMMALDLFAGSEIAWRTPYRSVAAPHHRGGAAIRDTVAVRDAATAEAAREVLAHRGVALLLVCVTAPPRGAFGADIAAGRTPDWLVPEVLPLPLDAFRLFLVRR